MRTFLIKIGARHCPNHNGTPEKSSDWEEGRFQAAIPKKVAEAGKRVEMPPPGEGDQAYIWVHETEGGKGLTARVTMADCQPDEDDVSFRASSIEVFKPPRIDFAFLEKNAPDSGAMRWIKEFTLRQTLELDDQEIADFNAAISEQEKIFQQVLEREGIGPDRATKTIAAERNWNDAELTAAVEAYQSMLVEQLEGRSFNKAEINRKLREGPLKGRSKGSVEFRMQNISAMLAELGLPTVQGYVPAKNIGAGVKDNLREIYSTLGYVDLSDYEPTSDPAELEKRSRKLRKQKLQGRPRGSKKPAKTKKTQTTFLRDPYVVAYVLEEAEGRCELCGQKAPFVKKDGEPFLEVHHVKTLSNAGSDTISNAVALCPNCHRACHYSQERTSLADQLYKQLKRLERE